MEMLYKTLHDVKDKGVVYFTKIGTSYANAYDKFNNLVEAQNQYKDKIDQIGTVLLNIL